MPKEINKTQELVLELIKRASFNEFDGERVVKELKENKELWESVLMTNDYCAVGNRSQCGSDLIALRDLPGDYWNVDTLYIMVKPENLDRMLELAENWNADEVDVLEDGEAEDVLGSHPTKYKVIRLWWD